MSKQCEDWGEEIKLLVLVVVSSLSKSLNSSHFALFLTTITLGKGGGCFSRLVLWSIKRVDQILLQFLIDSSL